jgi:hypothetical protein
MVRAYFRVNVPLTEKEEVATAARLAGYKEGEFLRILLREGWEVVRKRGIRRGDGLHFMEPGRDGRAGKEDPQGLGTTTSAVVG